MSRDFHASSDAQPHPARTRAILAAHPQVRQLYGRNPWTALIAVAVVLLQTSLALGFGWAGWHVWWLALLTAALVGAFANHCLYVVVHEATHRLVFKGDLSNRLVALFADLPNGFPAAMAFRRFHPLHHAHQGDYAQDADLASRWEAEWVGDATARKALWLLLFPVFQVVRMRRFSRRDLFNRWTVLNALSCLAYVAALVWVSGGTAAFYLVASFFLSVGLHPCGARWIQEHFTVDGRQETTSYYGPINVVALNVGYHNEHHDFPLIPWNRLPALRALAPEIYGPLQRHTSYVRLLRDFIFDSRYTLHSRVVRG